MGAIGEANVVLIPKVKIPSRIQDFKPIALCNVVYKLVAKMLANRLKVVLKEVISSNQRALLPGRLITDNVVLGFKCLHALRNHRSGKKGLLALKLDMAKTYDRVEWGFLRGIMSKLGFEDNWIRLIMNCVTSASYSFLINGEARGKVFPSKGIRQGCPLLPYLFLLFAEGLSALLLNAECVGDI
ncbi:hypothetical protein ACOSQ3_033200 [Xanthoceras sorbifolium]